MSAKNDASSQTRRADPGDPLACSASVVRPTTRGYEGPHPLPDELLDLDAEHLRGVHLAVEELDDALQLPGDGVRDEQQADPACPEVGLGQRPEVVGHHLGAGERQQRLGGVEPFLAASLLEPARQPIRRQEQDGVRGVVEHLARDLAADARVAGALHLDERGDRILVEEQVVHRPAIPGSFIVGQGRLAPDEEPAPRPARGRGSEEGWIAGQERL